MPTSGVPQTARPVWEFRLVKLKSHMIFMLGQGDGGRVWCGHARGGELGGPCGFAPCRVFPVLPSVCPCARQQVVGAGTDAFPPPLFPHISYS